MKNRDLLNLNNTLRSIEGRKATVKFSYFVAKNKILLKKEFDILESIKKPDPKFIEYDTKRAELAHKYSDKLENGQPRVENGNFIITKELEVFREELGKLKESYTDVIKDYEKQVKDFDELLDKEVEFTGIKIDLKDVPEEIEASVIEVLINSDLLIDPEQD